MSTNISPKSQRLTRQTSNSRKEVTLDDIWSSLLSIQESVSSHDLKLKAVVNNIKSLETSLKSFSTIVENVSAELILIKEEKAALGVEVKSLQEKMSRLENIPPGGVFSTNYDVYQESHQRLLKASRLMVFNVPPLADENPQQISKLVVDLFRDLSIQSTNISARRIGNVGSHSRPIFIEFNSPSDVRLILKSKSKMRNFERWKKTWISEDLTRMQHK
jgi:hypothetical protein